jgi:MFS family permease
VQEQSHDHPICRNVLIDMGGQGPTKGAALYALGFLTLISTFNYLDRSLLGLALPLIKAEMHVSDTMLGFVTGFAFVLFYSLLGVPIAWAADRYSRRNIIAVGFALWSLMTAAGGLCSNIWQIAATRLMMGAGEAAGPAPSNAMISDLFTPARRPLALSIYWLAFSIGSLFIFPILGWVAQVHGWRAMFIAGGLPGVLLAFVFFLTVKEPARGGTEAKAAAPAKAGMFESIAYLLSSPSYLLMGGCAACMGANLYAASTWSSAFLVRVHHMSVGEIAATTGPIRGVVSFIGIFGGGLLIDRLGRRNLNWRLWIPAIACLLAAPTEIMFLLGGSRWVWMTGFGLSSAFVLMHQAPVFALGMSVAPVRMRAMASALFLFCSAMIGQAIGPLLVGALNDYLTPIYGEEAIRYSLLINAITAVTGGVLLLLARYWIAADIARTERRDAAA